ncbi:MAG: hAT transposon family protein [Candidatus Acidiferrales bacterium]
MLLKTQVGLGSKRLVVLKPNDTRWSSTLIAAQRVLEMRRDIEACAGINDIDEIPSKDVFFASLGELCKFLSPFRHATDVIQSDKATLLTVFEQFAALLAHTRDTHRESAAAVFQRWQVRINVDATVAVAWLSFAEIPASLDENAAREFIISFGVTYLQFYDLVPGATSEQLRDDLFRQIGEFDLREGPFENVLKHKASLARTGWNPRLLWSHYQKLQLGRVALVLLSLSASEAAVERTFSAQAAVHTKKRNRLSNPTVQAEMFLKFNHHVMCATLTEPQRAGVVELDDEYDADDDVDDDAPTVVFATPDDPFAFVEAPIPPRVVPAASRNEPVPMSDDEEDWEAAPAAAAAASASERRRARREPSAVFTSSDEFVRWFIQEHHITPSTKWNGDLRSALERWASSRFPPPCPNTQTLVELVRAGLPREH